MSKELKLMVFDRGGATDVSPTEGVILSVHKVGEVGSTFANFRLGTFYSIISAERMRSSPDTVVVRLVAEDFTDTGSQFKVHYLDITKAMKDVEKAHAWDSGRGRNGSSVNVKTSIALRDTRE